MRKRISRNWIARSEAGDAENIEMPAMVEGPLGNAKGLDAILAKGVVWAESVEQIHGGSVDEPQVTGNWFSLPMMLDITMKGQPRMQMEVLCLYQVRDDKIMREQFFHGT